VEERAVGARTGTGQGGKITVLDVRKALEEGRQSRLLVRDAFIHGLYLRVGSFGGVWWLEYKPPGRDSAGRRHATRHLKLGDVRALSPDGARQAAAQAKQQVLVGKDPKGERAAAQQRLVAPGWTQIKANYLAHLRRQLVNNRSLWNETHNIEAVFGILDARAPLRELGLPDVHRVIDQSPATGVLARARVDALGRLLDWARSRNIIDVANPVRMLSRSDRPKPPAPRRRALSLSELGQLWWGTETLDKLERTLLRMQISLPLRRSEVAALEWDWINPVTGMITLPGKVMKTGEDHSLPLGAKARAVLDEIADNDWPVSGRVFKSNNMQLVNWSAFKRRVDARTPLPAWVFHDFRRSFVSVLAEHGHAEPVLDLMLAHRTARSGTMGVYQISQRLPDQRRAMAEWDRLLDGAIDGGGNVVKLRA
jgi:integrase